MSYSTGRPSTARDVTQVLSGAPLYLGVLVSTGTAVNNSTTTTPFANAPSPAGKLYGNPAYIGTLAGRTLIVQSSAAGYLLPHSTADITVTNQTLPTGALLTPGLYIGSQERVQLMMLPTFGWLQWLPDSGSANLFVWELK